ncbi:MAG: DNA helicase II [Pseudomonadota bacterium]
MDVTPILDPLNDAQREAVTGASEPMLVLAGAGSGKTRVLVHRMAWLMQVENVSPQGLMAVTFTNKAAAEMRYRTEQLLEVPATGLWVGTFHGLAHRLLRRHWQEADLIREFQILDSEDQYRLIRRVLKNMELDEGRWSPKEVRWFINHHKDAGRRPPHIDHDDDPVKYQFIEIYKTYDEACQRSGLVDFAELLLRAHELWLNNEDLLEHYRNRFRHILVDEFQDTNAIQYAWLRVLSGSTGVPFAVGDDDQSIYGWRGAKIENIHRFQKDFPGTKVVRLEQNYRSTGNILSAANQLIAHNSERMGKNLWTASGEGDLIRLYSAYNERDEAEFVINRIKDWVAQGNRRQDVAVLYRSNAQSRVFEETLLNAGMPYRVYGGLRFFDRAEIKDALAYLRLAASYDDDPSFERIVNTPTRGIGAKTVDAIREYAKNNATSLWNAAGALASGELPRRAATAVAQFMQLIQKLTQVIKTLELHEQVDHVITHSGLLAHYQKEKGERGEARVENLEELVSAARGFEPEEDLDMPILSAFLSHAALESVEGQADAWEDCVQMMTLHTAKGLEFPLVFLCGLEDGLFPHLRSLQDASGIEEERRLCYVGMTRAMQQLYITYAEQRRLHGMDSYAQPSRFIKEIPPDLLDEVRPSISVSSPLAAGRFREMDTGPSGVKLGQRVRHAKFGDGMVLNYEGQGAHAQVQVNFEQAGTKWLVMAYANLEVL